MKVSIVIPTLNEGPNIAKSVSAGWATGADEIVVADGGSHDATATVARQADCRVIVSRPGRSIQLNAGAQVATGDVLLFQHADNWLGPQSVIQVRNALADPSIWGGAFRQHIESRGRVFRVLEWGNALRVSWLGLPFGDQGIFLRRTVFERLGGFPNVDLLEDFLLMKKLRRRSRPVLLPGPIHVDPRRWNRYGVVRQTLRNWTILTACQLGMAPNRLARFYARHDPES